MSRQRLTPTIPHPALVAHAQERAEYIQNRIADRITRYAGSMHFVYLHIALFVIWTLLDQDHVAASDEISYPLQKYLPSPVNRSTKTSEA